MTKTQYIKWYATWCWMLAVAILALPIALVWAGIEWIYEKTMGNYN